MEVCQIKLTFYSLLTTCLIPYNEYWLVRSRGRLLYHCYLVQALETFPACHSITVISMVTQKTYDFPGTCTRRDRVTAMMIQ